MEKVVSAPIIRTVLLRLLRFATVLGESRSAGIRPSVHPSRIFPSCILHIFVALLFLLPFTLYFVPLCRHVRTFTLVCAKRIPLGILDYKLYKSIIIIIAPDQYSARARAYVTTH